MENFNKRFSDLQNFANFLGSEYVWEKTKDDWSVNFAPLTKMYIVGSGSSSGTVNISYSDSCDVSSDGTLSLVDAQRVAVSYDNYATTTEALKGKYIKGFFNDATRICYVPQDSQITAEYSSIYYVYATLRECSSFYGAVNYGYVNSPDPNAYPVDDGYTYTPLGMLGEKTRIATGSYKGTGTVGRNNKNSLTFDFEPKLLIIRTPSPSGYAVTIGVTFVYGIDWQFNDVVGPSESGCYVSWEGNTVTWYAEKQAGDQSNNSGTKYYYIALG